MKRFEYLGYTIEYSRFQKRWFIQDYDYEQGFIDLASAPTKSAAMNKVESLLGL